MEILLNLHFALDVFIKAFFIIFHCTSQMEFLSFGLSDSVPAQLANSSRVLLSCLPDLMLGETLVSPDLMSSLYAIGLLTQNFCPIPSKQCGYIYKTLLHCLPQQFCQAHLEMGQNLSYLWLLNSISSP